MSWASIKLVIYLRDCFSSTVIPDKWSKTPENPGSSVFPWDFYLATQRLHLLSTELIHLTLIQFNSLKSVGDNKETVCVCVVCMCVCEWDIKGVHTHFIVASVVFLVTDCSSHYRLFVFGSVDTCCVTEVIF